MAMEYKLPPVLDVIRGNIIKHGNPLAMKGGEVAAWAKGLNLPRQGDFLLYTGGEYQLIPFIDGLVKTMTQMDTASKGFSLMMGVRNLLDKAGINAEKLYASVVAKDRERFNQVSYKAAVILKELGLQPCYLGEEELYSGALLYELGYWEDLRQYAQKVAQLLQSTGARQIVCLSPHSAEVLRLVYPKLVPGFNLEILTLVEVIHRELSRLPRVNYGTAVTIHDSCRMARELNITEEIREILAAMGVKVLEADHNRRWTTCCGGPGKILFAEVCYEVGCRRAEELAASGADLALTFCPYCLAALEAGNRARGASLVVEDFIEFVYRGFDR